MYHQDHILLLLKHAIKFFIIEIQIFAIMNQEKYIIKTTLLNHGKVQLKPIISFDNFSFFIKLNLSLFYLN